MTTEEKVLYKAVKKNLELMKECNEVLKDINKINKVLDKEKNKK